MGGKRGTVRVQPNRLMSKRNPDMENKILTKKCGDAMTESDGVQGRSWNVGRKATRRSNGKFSPSVWITTTKSWDG